MKRRDEQLRERIKKLLKERDEIMKAADLGGHLLAECAALFVLINASFPVAQAELHADQVVSPKASFISWVGL